MGDGSLNCNAWGLHPEDWLETLPWDTKDGKAVKAALLDQYKDWDPRLTAAMSAADEHSIVSRKFWQLPIGTKWEARDGVMLIGDAAHLATPFSGEGVNIAMEDAMELAKAILCTSSNDTADLRHCLAARVATYEQEMFARAHGVQTRASGNMHDMLLQEGAPRTGIESWLIRGAGKDIPPGSWSMIALKVVVYTGYFFVKLVI
jgi:2-polyprenyl-6-methoxyphenol hydroxylase-like FAD-dependent oxidoreductase